MWPFTRTPEPEPLDIGPRVYMRWLRAGRPSDWFFDMGEEEQELLAQTGDQFTKEYLLDMGFAIADPQFAQAADNAEPGSKGEADLLQTLVKNAIASKLGGETNAVPSTLDFSAPSMGGKSLREAKARHAKLVDNNQHHTLGGVEPNTPDAPTDLATE